MNSELFHFLLRAVIVLACFVIAFVFAGFVIGWWTALWIFGAACGVTILVGLVKLIKFLNDPNSYR